MLLEAFLAVGLLVGSAIIVANWDSVVKWLHDFVPKLKDFWTNIRETIPHGGRFYGDIIMKVVDGVERMLSRIKQKMIYQEDEQWVEQTTTRLVDQNQVPAAIRAKIQQQEADITEALEKETQMTLVLE